MKIQIICSSPGMWRNGIPHPASEFYPADRWDEKQLERFRADPAFTVREVDDAENTMTDTDFQLRVDAEVSRQVKAKADGLQASFDAVVRTAVESKTAELKAEHDNAMDKIGKDLAAANDKVAKLEKQIADAKKASKAGEEAGAK
ncbi:hypothetical protein B5K08_15850 [Rhizobium leguminosarum bv. trifolii]|uniref:Uncharacterized protein n=1 Tax=Rhizobium leguminosarum bv. trifolii TaxID=386 RepID=A0A3E1BGZ8_RHILT|nr:hypothetical protein [Rhizobium leguminosarum]RFB91770.1 hypothetical protein B5K08_15850 [Rhizobium leguminosarum bv. trifolii]RFB92287.1 hypothetical protein B5K10_15845 [Rhizobium leguminosarum bv. trifolii]